MIQPCLASGASMMVWPPGPSDDGRSRAVAGRAREPAYADCRAGTARRLRAAPAVAGAARASASDRTVSSSVMISSGLRWRTSKIWVAVSVSGDVELRDDRLDRA